MSEQRVEFVTLARQPGANRRALPHWQQRRNELIERRRALVEKVCGTLKRSYRYQRVAYCGLGRNRVELWFKLMAFNFRKADTLAWRALTPGSGAPRAGPGAGVPHRRGPPGPRGPVLVPKRSPTPHPRPNIANYSKVSTGRGDRICSTESNGGIAQVSPEA